MILLTPDNAPIFCIFVQGYMLRTFGNDLQADQPSPAADSSNEY